MSGKQRSKPPDLPNFHHRSWLGGGGFADVFLYDQLRPAREVAVKVLRTAALDPASHAAFDAEADLMAKVSAHPYIVTIYGADVAPDGRPYLVMEYYPKPHFGQRARSGPLPVPEVLRVGVRVASAVETAHRAGILHRDIKPANILVNQYDRPGLTDFGIAGARDGSSLAGQGVTVAYAPPEVLVDESVAGDELGDVYSLAATLYALLAGRAPFEATTGDNSSQAVLSRTLRTPAEPIGRSNVPRSLELLLDHAMAKDPAHRPASAAALGRALQGIERELQLAVTDFELIGEEPEAPVRSDDDADGTRTSRVQVVRPSGPAPSRAAPISGIPTDLPDLVSPDREREHAPVPEAPRATDTVARARAAAHPPEPAAPSAPSTARLDPARKRAMVIGGGVVALIVAGAVVASSGGGGGGTTTTTQATLVPDPVVTLGGATPQPPQRVLVDLEDGVATVRWSPQQAEPGDIYVITRTDLGSDIALGTSSTPVHEVPGIEAGEQPCFEVAVDRGGLRSGPSEEGCVDT